MATEKKPKRTKHTTPRGTFVFPRVNKPDTKFKEAGEFSTRFHLPAAAAAPLMISLDAMVETAYAEAIQSNEGKTFVMVKGKKKQIEKNEPYVKVLADDGETETGMIEFKFGMNATFKDKEGNIKSRKPGIFDAAGKPMTAPVWGGSEGKVSYTVGPYFIKGSGAAGAKLYLEAIQVLKLVSGSGGDAKSFGFGSEEGYTADDDLPTQDGEEGGEDAAGEGKPGAGSDF